MNNKKTIGWRHGDICGIKIKSLSKGLKKSDTKTLLQTGSSGNPHTFDNGIFYPKINGDFVIGYLKAKNTKLFHFEHSPDGALIPDGNYEIRHQSEYLPDGLRPIID